MACGSSTQSGPVAEDAEKVNPDLVASDEQGRPYTVRYEAVNALLLRSKSVDAAAAGAQF